MSRPPAGASVPRSASNSSRKTYFLTFPDGVSGKVSTTLQCRGVLCGASRSRQYAKSAPGSGVRPGAGRMNAATCSPQTGSGTPARRHPRHPRARTAPARSHAGRCSPRRGTLPRCIRPLPSRAPVRQRPKHNSADDAGDRADASRSDGRSAKQTRPVRTQPGPADPARLSRSGRRSPACRRRTPCRSGCTCRARVRRPAGCSGEWPQFPS